MAQSTVSLEQASPAALMRAAYEHAYDQGWTDGLPIIPATPEAIFVSLVDNIDAKMNMALTVARDDDGVSNEAEGDFTEKMWALENVRLFRPDPTKIAE